MKETGYHELNPLVRGKELELLNKDVFERLLQAETLEEIGEILKSTHYASLIHPGFEHDFEQNLAKSQEQSLTELIELVPEKEVIWVYTMRFTFHNLKVLNKAEVLNQNFDDLYIPDGLYSLKTLKEAIHVESSDQLPDAVMDCIHEVKKYLEESNVLQGIDVICDRYFLREQRRLGEKLGYPELLDEIISFIDLTNFIILARGLQQKRSVPFMTAVLSSSGSIEKEELLTFVDQDVTKLIQFMKQSSYGEILAPALKGDEIDFVQLESIKDNFLTNKYESAQIQAFGPMPLLAFLNAKEVERKNLQLIITGKKSGIKAGAIQERMRDVL